MHVQMQYTVQLLNTAYYRQVNHKQTYCVKNDKKQNNTNQGFKQATMSQVQ